MHVKKGDKVVVISGADKGKSGVIERAFPQADRVLIEGINVRKKHQKPTRSGGKGQIVDKSYPIHVSNVRLADKKSKKK